MFLDLQKDKYLCLSDKYSDVIRDLIEDEKPKSPANHAVIDVLLQTGLIEKQHSGRKASRRLLLSAPNASLLDSNAGLSCTVRPSHVWAFFRSATLASASLRWRTIEQTVHYVTRHRPRHPIAGTSSADIIVVAELKAVFQQLRPFYPRAYLCLFDSLSLLLFLATFDIFPRWVFGVRLKPFCAHCWLQLGDWVVDDRLDNVRPYSPIMCV